MIIKMQATAAGPDGVLQQGREYEVDAKQARSFVDGGYASFVKSPKIETAAIEAPEKAVTERPKPRVAKKKKPKKPKK